jgi:DNA-binding FadR family transcriptional regulator
MARNFAPPTAFPEATAVFHRRLVELTGNTTLALIAAMLHEITEHHLAGTPKPTPTRSDYRRLAAAFQSLIDLLRSGDRDLAQAHWRAHRHTVAAGLRHRRFAGHRR